MAVSDRLLNVEECADFLGVSTKFVRRHAVELGASKVGSHLRFRRADVDAYLEARRLWARRGAVRPLQRAI